ncbi:unnamed protein product [Caenorhabditis brenneri]
MLGVPRNPNFFYLMNACSTGYILTISVLLVFIWRYLTSPKDEPKNREFVDWDIDFCEDEIENEAEEREENESIHEESEDENLLKPSEIPDQLMSFLGPMVANGFVFKKVEQPVLDKSHYGRRATEQAEKKRKEEENRKKKLSLPVPKAHFQDRGSNPFECPVCLVSYSDEITPRVLACGHTICTECVKMLGDRIGEDFLMRCPMCTSRFMVLPKNVLRDIKVNHALKDIVEKREELKGQKAVSRTPQCYNCHQGYSSHIPQLIPRVLASCGHTECEGCVLEKIVGKRSYVRCSECGKDSGLYADWETSIVKNFSLMDVVRM